MQIRNEPMTKIAKERSFRGERVEAQHVAHGDPVAEGLRGVCGTTQRETPGARAEQAAASRSGRRG